MYPQGCSSPFELFWYRIAPVATFEASVSIVNDRVGSGISRAGLCANRLFRFVNASCLSWVHCQGVFDRVSSCSGFVISEYFGMNLR